MKSKLFVLLFVISTCVNAQDTTATKDTAYKAHWGMYTTSSNSNAFRFQNSTWGEAFTNTVYATVKADTITVLNRTLKYLKIGKEVWEIMRLKQGTIIRKIK